MVRRFLFISTFVLTVTSSVGAVAVQIDDPTDGTVQHGTILFNISDNEGTSFDTVSSINISRNETTEVGINDSFGDVSTVQVSVDTQGTDGFFNYTAAAWNSSTGRLDSDTIDLTIDNTAPSFNIVSPTENSVINTTSDLNISAVQDRDTSPSVAYTLENDTGNYSTDGGSAIHGWTELSSPYETTLDPTVLVDGAYTLWVNATDDQDNTAVKSQDLTIDSAPPSITLNTPNDGALIGGTSTINFSMMDNGTTVDHDSVAVAVETTDGNRTVNDEQGWSTLDQDGAFYTTTINTTAFSEDTYDVWVRANDSSNNEAVSQYSFTFDNTAPSITTYEINETTGTSDSDIGRFSHVELGVDVQEPGETDTCRVDIIPAATWGTDDQSTERSIPLNTSGTNDFENTSADLTGLQGNYTFNAVCKDEAGNVGQQQTITTPSGSFSWFAFDAAGPEIDETSISPSNATWTDENSPSLS
ncbi:MAG: Ig-like domain-containing protein, partial [Candidatus Nanohaloarchaeota archaeon QJJ-5]|nr:Ig-like domain-containing protein [Candidatus Nanohaloarchaeota archaeon QJJ-5]